MGTFKNWLQYQEITLGSDNMRDNAPTQTARATNAVANKWLSDPRNSNQTSNMVQMGQSHPSALSNPLLKAGALAVKSAGSMGHGVAAPSVAFDLQTSLKLPTILKAPKIGQVKMMRKKMRSV